MLGLEIRRIDAFAVEVFVQVLDLLIASKQHQTARAARCFHIVLNVVFTCFRHYICRDPYLIASMVGIFSSLFKHCTCVQLDRMIAAYYNEKSRELALLEPVMRTLYINLFEFLRRLGKIDDPFGTSDHPNGPEYRCRDGEALRG